MGLVAAELANLAPVIFGLKNVAALFVKTFGVFYKGKKKENKLIRVVIVISSSQTMVL